MARFTGENIDKYGSQSSGSGSFFSLKDDGDIGRVRFMYNGAEDVSGYSVHRVQVGDKERYVNCLREYDSPISDCPFCRDGLKTYAKLFVPIYNEDTQEAQVWERGKKFYGEISSVCSRYKDTVSHIFEIERRGKKGDQATTYGIYEVGKDETRLEDLPEAPDPLGTIILDKTAEDMEEYLSRGSFPSEAPVRRRSEPTGEMPRRSTAGRRTPTNRGDRF